VAGLLAVRSEWFVRAAGMVVAIGTIGAFILSRRGDGLFDFREQGLHPSPQAAIALVVEIAALVLLAVTFLPAVIDEPTMTGRSTTGMSIGIAAVVMIALGVYWANRYDASTSAAETGVHITDFTFSPTILAVTKGSTVTWINGDTFDHSIVATDLTFHSDSIGHDGTFQHTFDEDGEFSYVCGIHPQMQATVTVTG
ncbi:MAG TPA: plastocyanin/azurin family copper-binding protein, partial [Ilumatobacteraceae bacterium]|nr:plastocyanin/azurin family copper-binding protein [Ilumatobacteraceae bacterium]